MKFKTKKSKVQRYNFKDLKRVTISSGYGTGAYANYVRLKIKGQDRYKVLEEVILGKVNLYQKI